MTLPWEAFAARPTMLWRCAKRILVVGLTGHISVM
jgi:hypothetical protein